MADAQGAVDRFRALLAAWQENHEIERNRSVCLMKAELLDDEARAMGDEMLDGDMAALIERQAVLRNLAVEYRQQARMFERQQLDLMWRVKEISPNTDNAA